jgi:hypothetical protein
MLLSNVSFFALMMEHDSEPNKLKVRQGREEGGLGISIDTHAYLN